MELGIEQPTHYYSHLIQMFVNVKQNQMMVESKRNDETFLSISDTVIQFNSLSIEEKIRLELESIGLLRSNSQPVQMNETPKSLTDFLNSLREKSIEEFQNLTQVIKDKSIESCCPFSCVDSNLNRSDANFHYIKFACKLHTEKKQIAHHALKF